MDTLIFGNSLTAWLVAIAIILAAAVLGRVVGGFIKAFVKRLGSVLLATILDHTIGLLTLMVTLVGVRIALESLALPKSVDTMVGLGLKFLFTVVLTWLVVRIYDAAHKCVFEPYARRPDSMVELHLLMVVRTFSHVLIWVIGIVSGLNSIGFEVSAILAGLGIGGMAMALASQDTVANIFGGIVVLTQRPFKVGERIEVGGVNGWVQKIGLRNTTVANWYGRLVQIPNKHFTDGIVTNIDSQPCYFIEARLRIDAWTPPDLVEKAMAKLKEIATANPLLQETHWVALDKIEMGYLELEFWYAIDKWKPSERDTVGNEYNKICLAKTGINMAILRAFSELGVKLALPMRLEMRRDLPNDFNNPLGHEPQIAPEGLGAVN